MIGQLFECKGCLSEFVFPVNEPPRHCPQCGSREINLGDAAARKKRVFRRAPGPGRLFNHADEGFLFGVF